MSEVGKGAGTWFFRVTLALALIGLLYGSYELGASRREAAVVPVTPALRLASAEGNARVERERGLFSELARQLSPSVVHIKVRSRQATPEQDLGLPPGLPEEFRRFFGGPGGRAFPPRETQGQGSGVIISPDGEILTNNHVIRGATEITVVLDDERELPGKVVGADPRTDLAVVKVHPSTPLKAATLGDSDAIEVGDWVMAIGNPFGLSHTVTVGVISGKGRVLGGAYDQFLQTDASINPGNSGGPLFDTSGRVVGISTAILSDGQGIGFAIPINQARQVAEQLRTSGSVTRGYVGLGIQPVTPRMAAALGLPEGTRGALVGSVVPGAPGDRAGAREGDVIVEFNGRPLADERDLLNSVAAAPVGSRAKLGILREGQMKTLELEIARRPGEEQALREAPVATAEEALGLSVRDLTPEAARRLGLSGQEGVVVTAVRPGSPAAQAGLVSGDVVRRVGNRPVRNAEEFQRLVAGKGDLALLIVRGGNQVFMLVEREAG